MTPEAAAKSRCENPLIEAARHATVLFADVNGSTRLYEAAGDEKALEAIGACVEALRRATHAAGGRVVKTIGDEVMALFPTADAAADAATRMHMAVNALPALGEHKLAIRIGFHSGPVIQRDKDVFGDTVNLASRLVEQATKGQVLTSADTVSLLTPAVRNNTRRLYDVTVKGKADDVALCELLWQESPDITQLPRGQAELKRPQVSIRLSYRGRELVCRRRVEWITVGRDPSSVFVISDPLGSRQHCVIERRQDRFWIRDYSSNGTYVTVEGESAESVLRREELSLRGHGWLAFGQPKSKAVELLEYWCEQR